MIFLRVAGHCSIIPTPRMTTPTEMHHFSVYSMAFVMYIQPLDLGGALEKTLILASPDLISLFYGQTLITNFLTFRLLS